MRFYRGKSGDANLVAGTSVACDTSVSRGDNVDVCTRIARMKSLLVLALLAFASPATAAPAVVGKKAPDFKLQDLDGKTVKLSSFKGKTVVLEWFNPGCPYVKKSHTVGSLVTTAKQHTQNGVVWLAINSAGSGKQGFDPEENRTAVKTWSLEHPVLLDPTGATGKAYGATNTPHMFVIDPKGTLVYAGAIDNSRDGEGKSPEGGTLINYVNAALEDLAAKRKVKTPQTKAYGCGVKYGS
jgi:peroxiredoxin